MPRQKAPEVGFGIVPTGRYMGDVNGSIPNNVGPVVPGDFFVDRSTLPAVWVVNTGAALSSNATIYPIYSGNGSTAASVSNSSLFTGTGVVIAGTTTPSTPVAVSTAAVTGYGLVARSSIAAPNVRWEHVELFGLSSLYATQGQIIAGSTTPSTPLAVTATTVLGAAPVYRTTTGVGLAFEIPNSTFYSGQGVFIVGTTSAGMTVVPTATAGSQLVFRTSVAGGWNPETVSGSVQSLVGARAYSTSDQQLASGTYTAITMTNAAFNNGTVWASSAPTRLTPTASGVYAITGSIAFNASTTGERNVLLKLNGSTYIGFNITNATTGTPIFCCDTIYALTTSDYIELFGMQNSGSTTIGSVGSNGYTHIAMAKIPATT